MENYLRKNFEVEPKNPSEEALRKWRSAVSIVKNPNRRFRMVADLEKRRGAQQTKLSIQEKNRIALYVQKTALQFIDAGTQETYNPPEEVRKAGYDIDGHKLAVMVRNHDTKSLESLRGVEGIARKLSVKIDEGVSASELPLRQHIFGSNQFVEKLSKNFWTFIWEALQDLTLIMLMICGIISIGLGIATEGWPIGIYDGLGIIICILLVVIVTSISDYKQYLQFRDLDKEKNKTFVQVRRDGYRQKVCIDDLVVGDIVRLLTGDCVPADGIFIYGYNLLIDESSLSGESDPVEIGRKRPFLLSGTKVQGGSGDMLVASVGMRTQWGSLMQTLSESGEDETPMQVKLNGITNIIAMIGLVFAVLTFVVLVARFLVEKVVHNEFLVWSYSDALKLLNYFAIVVTIVVIAVPEGLPLAVTLSLAHAMKQLMNDQAVVRHLSACEAMGSSSCICTDKTGTLTINHMAVAKIWICEEIKIIGGTDSGDILKTTISERVLSILLQSIFQNTSSEMVKGKDGKNTILGTPTESALLEFGLLLGGNFNAQHREAEVVKVEHFNSIRKKMSMLVALPTGMHRAFCSGAPEVILKMCDKMIDNTGSSMCLSEAQVKNVMDVINAFACEALRILSLAFKDVDETSCRDSIPTDGYTLIAVVGMKNPIRPGVKDAVQTCLATGINVRMVTGDNINTAKAVAKECGILKDEGLAIEGPDFRSMSPQEMNELIPKLQVLARSLPSDKYILVNQLRKFGEVVAVTGDGANDAPALHESDIGLAMGIAGTKVAKENADVIILDDNFATIVNVVKWGRAVYINIQKFIQFQLTVIVVALMLNFVSACLSGSARLTAVQLLWVNMIMDTLGALALATEPPNDDLMKRPPVGRGVSFITRTMWRNIIGQSIYQLVVLGVLEFYGMRLLKLNGPDTSSMLNTFIFNTFVFCQVFNEINSRDMEKINVFRGISDSWVFIIVMVVMVAFQIIMVEFLGAFASTVPLSWQLWLLSILIGSLSMIVAVILKCIPVEQAKHGEKYHDGYEELPSGPELAWKRRVGNDGRIWREIEEEGISMVLLLSDTRPQSRGYVMSFRMQRCISNTCQNTEGYVLIIAPFKFWLETVCFE